MADEERATFITRVDIADRTGTVLFLIFRPGVFGYPLFIIKPFLV